MPLLILFALLAGAGTALSPCVLPILPVVLGAGVTGGRRRPLGVVTGLVLAFSFSTVALVYLIDAFGLPIGIQRTIAVVVLVVFGVSLLFPPVSDRIEAFISRFVGAPRMQRGEGFASGVLVGAGLGLVYAPCAGPILAGVITVSAAQDFTLGRLLVAFAYALGSGIVLYALIKGGRRLSDRVNAQRARIQMVTGALMIAVALLMSADLDVRFQNSIANDLPDFLTNPTGGLEENDAIASQISDVRGGGHGAATEAGAAQAAAGDALPVLGPAPDFVDTQRWFNTGGRQLSIDRLTSEGKVVLIDFWTYTCINCIRTLPELVAWDETYRDDGLVVIGVHAPEFPFERDASNVEEAISRNGIGYPVVQDNELGTWNAFGNQYWPAKYLIGADGNIRYTHFGEGQYEETEKAIRSLLSEADGGQADLGKLTAAKTERADPGLRTPETYLGARRAAGFVNGPIPPGTSDFGAAPGHGERIVDLLPANGFAYQGRWRISADGATALAGARVDANFRARKVFLVMGSPGRTRSVRVLLDGKPISARDAGEDVSHGVVEVGPQRLYRLVDLGRAKQRVLSLEFGRGVSGYAFTFG